MENYWKIRKIIFGEKSGQLVIMGLVGGLFGIVDVFGNVFAVQFQFCTWRWRRWKVQSVLKLHSTAIEGWKKKFFRGIALKLSNWNGNFLLKEIWTCTRKSTRYLTTPLPFQELKITSFVQKKSCVSQFCKKQKNGRPNIANLD